MRIILRRTLANLAVVTLFCTACAGTAAPVLEHPGVSRVSPPDGPFLDTLVWSHDGSRIAVTNQVEGGDILPVAKIYILDVASGRLDLLLEARNAYRWVQFWSPDGKEIVFSAYVDVKGIWAVNADGSGQPRFLSNGFLAALSPTGEQMAVSDVARAAETGVWTESIWIVDLETGDKWLAFSRSGSNTFGRRLAWSPDGTRLTFAFGPGVVQGRGAHLDIYVLDLDTGGVKQLTQGGNNDFPSWSPDGRLIAYTSTADYRQSALTIARVDGSCSAQLLNVPDFFDDAAWSPDGKKIAFSWGGSVYLVDVAALLGEDFLTAGPVCP